MAIDTRRFEERLVQDRAIARARARNEELALRIPIVDIYTNFTNPNLLKKQFKSRGG